ncbi:hypothetical protein Q2T40_14255 [Winogradskyella maritima]|uniref:Tissue inhibitor of metalloproteinase n=1 Tax=Winogradskyella maritima TaxID=1517766 RepID=A0ABV8AG64_9FLAO|nr:hypothetical protein [Winogradskyella maritima]
MKQVRYFLHIVVFSSLTLQAQDPSCNYVVNISEINTNKYDYQIFVHDNKEKVSINNLKKILQTNWSDYDNGKLYQTVLTSNKGKELLIAYSRNYCYDYPSNEKNKIRIVISRKLKRNSKIKLMYAKFPMHYETTEINIQSFSSGERNIEEIAYKPTKNDRFESSGFQYFLSVLPRKIYIK